MQGAVRNAVRRRGLLLEALAGSRAVTRPLDFVRDRQRAVDELSDRLRRAIRQQVERARRRIEGIGGTMDALSPLKVLSRGYSLTRREASGEMLRRAGDVAVGERIETRLGSGRLTSLVEATED